MLYGNLCFRRHSKKPQSLSFSKAPPNDTEDLGFVKDSYPISSALFLEFENGEGYPLLLKVLLR